MSTGVINISHCEVISTCISESKLDLDRFSEKIGVPSRLIEAMQQTVQPSAAIIRRACSIAKIRPPSLNPESIAEETLLLKDSKNGDDGMSVIEGLHADIEHYKMKVATYQEKLGASFDEIAQLKVTIQNLEKRLKEIGE